MVVAQCLLHTVLLHSVSLADLQLGKFTVKLNHRRLLDAMLAIAGVPAQKFRPICRSDSAPGSPVWAVDGL